MNPKGCIPARGGAAEGEEKEWITEKVVLDQVGARAGGEA